LEPDVFRFRGENIVEMCGEILWPSKHIHHIDGRRNIRHLAINLLAENLGRVRVINWNGDNFISPLLGILRNVKGRLIARLGTEAPGDAS
jgi:hypothetical protein